MRQIRRRKGIKINMEDRGVSEDLLREMYVEQQMTLAKMREELNVSEGVLNRWLKESGIEKRKGSGYDFDIHFFDRIDTEEKAYFIGFVWCDGYLQERFREGVVTEVPLKISLAEHDKDILETLKSCVKSNHPIHTYKMRATNFSKNSIEVRLTLNNKYFGYNLKNKYGMFPRRECVSKLVKNIPEHLENHFLRGVFDADGSLVNYHLKSGSNIGGLKSVIGFSTYRDLIDWIQELLIRKNIKDNKVKTYKRHMDSDDDTCLELKLAGILQVKKICEFLYEGATVYSERKYGKYIELKEMIKNREQKRE